MDQFEKAFEDLDVKATDMNAALDNVYQSGFDQSEVLSFLTSRWTH